MKPFSDWKTQIRRLFVYHPMIAYGVVLAVVGFAILSLFIDIGYFFAIAAIYAFYKMGANAAKSDPEVLKGPKTEASEEDKKEKKADGENEKTREEESPTN